MGDGDKMSMTMIIMLSYSHTFMYRAVKEMSFMEKISLASRLSLVEGPEK